MNAATKLGAIRKRPATQAFEAFLATSQAARFFPSDVVALVYQFTSPRSRDLAAEFADTLMRAAVKAGRIQQRGSLHWFVVRPQRFRRLSHSGVAPELTDPVRIDVRTRCPNKWALVDMETGSVLRGEADGTWSAADDETRRNVLAAVSPGRPLGQEEESRHVLA